MGDQLISIDHLLSTIALIGGSTLAMRRVADLTLTRSKHLIKDLINSGEWYSVLFRNYLKLSTDHLLLEASQIASTSIPVRKDPDILLRGNYHVWRLVHNIINHLSKYSNGEDQEVSKKRIKASIQSALYRSGIDYNRSDIHSCYETLSGVEEIASALTHVETVLWDLHALRAREHNEDCSKDNLKEQEITHSMTMNSINADMLIFSDLVFLKLGDYSCIFTKVHFERLTKMLRTLTSYCISFSEWESEISFTNFFISLFDELEPLYSERPDFVGEVIKASRAIMIAELDKSMIMGYPAVDAYIGELNKDRKYWALKVTHILRRSFKTSVAAINVANVYKMVPHPDANMEKLFRTVEGVQEPNSVNRRMISRFTGTLRRALYSSLSAQGYEVRVESTSDSGIPIQEATAATRKYGAKLRIMNPQAWSCTKFLPVRNLIDIDSFEVKASSKSSQIAPNFQYDDLELSALYQGGVSIERPLFIDQARTINDSASEAIGVSRLDSENAIERFKRVISLHEKFESRFVGTDIDNISSEDLANFVQSEPDARYLVGTEPKFGEVHKEVTRMFYMAQQELKAITQRVERYTKQVCRKQPGVSITKSYTARRKDLESFCRNMVGSGFDKRSVFVSFDMSEFSKRFPMVLVRKFGEILSEISGKDWLKRIDLVFRASIVIHNSRGYFAHLAGVRGGFEGFFNFIWSSIHASVMEIALEATGLQGEILVFSDDGLLLFYPPSEWSMETVRRKIYAIQRIYNMFGLSFNLGKTLISDHIWEYLGDVCYNNRLLPMWIKELSSITRNVKNRGLEPFYSKVKSLQAQVDAAVAAGFDPFIAYIIKRFYFGLLIDRIGVKYNHLLEETMAIVPTSCGGLRITSPYEMTCLSTIEKDAEIIADLVLMNKVDKHLPSAIMQIILSEINKRKDPVRMVISGSRLVTNHPDTSGMGVINECIDLISVSPRVKNRPEKNPFSGTFSLDFHELLMTLENINLGLIIDFIYSTPTWVEYSNSMALVRSSGVLRVVKRSALRILQSKDTRRVRESLNQWSEALLLSYHNYKKISPLEFINKAQKIVFPEYDLAVLRPSPRIALILSHGKPDLEVRLDIDKECSITDISYNEPIVRMSKDETTLFWTSEAGGSSETRSIRRFVNSITRVLSHSPELEGAIINICKFLGTTIPPLPTGLVRGAHRKGGGLTKGIDVRINLPRWYMANSESRYLGALSDYIYSVDRADRTTYVEAARCLAYFKVRWTNSLKPRIREGVSVIGFEIYDILWSVIHDTQVMTSKVEYYTSIPQQVLSEMMIREYQSSYLEHTEAMATKARLLELAGIANDATGYDLKMVIEIYRLAIKRWLISFRSAQSSTLIQSFFMPLPNIMIQEILIGAAVDASLQSMPPQMRRRLLDRVNEWLASMSTEEYEQFIPDLSRSEPLTAFYNEITEYFFILESAVPEEYEVRLPSIEFGLTTDIMRNLARYSMELNILDNPRIIVMRTTGSIFGKITASHRAAFKEAFTSTLSAFYTLCTRLGWDRDKIYKQIGSPLDPDIIITCLIVTRELLRESPHRSKEHPYNPTTAGIELFKISSFIKHIYIEMEQSEELSTEEKFDPLNFYNDEILINKMTYHELNLEEQLDLLSFYRLKSTDTDHMDMISRGIPPIFHQRVIQEVRYGWRLWKQKRRLRYQVRALEIKNILSNFADLITKTAVRSLKEYSSELEKVLLTRFNPSASSTVRMAELSTTATSLVGTHVNLSGLENKVDAIQMLQEHVRDYVVRNRISGIEPSFGSNIDLSLTAAPLIAQDGQSISFASDPIMSDLYIYFLEYEQPTRAISDYVLLSLTENPSATVFKDSRSGKYYIVAVTNILLLSEGQVEEPIVSIGQGYRIDSFIPVYSFRAQTARLSSSIQTMVLSNQADEFDFRRVQAMSRRSRRIDRRSQVENSSIMLLAAYNLINGSIDNNAVTGSYIGILMWLRGDEDFRRIEIYARALREKLNQSDRGLVVRVSQDISLTANWLLQMNLAPSIDIDDSELIRFTDELRRFSFPIRVPVTATVSRVRTVAEVYSELAGRRNLTGSISSYLFEVEMLPLLEDVVTNIDQAIQEEVDQLVGDL